jgi:tRNA (cytidine/uridine-2'-O-)-methyltransferase
MFHVVLYQPEIPPNTGNIVRLCANTGTTLHLVRPLGFSLSDRQLARAGLDYDAFAQVLVHDCWEACREALGSRRMFALSTCGETRYDRADYRAGDALLFGPETRGLPRALLSAMAPGTRLHVPMASNSRSLNLSNAVAVVVYEAWRQHGFACAQGARSTQAAHRDLGARAIPNANLNLDASLGGRCPRQRQVVGNDGHDMVASGDRRKLEAALGVGTHSKAAVEHDRDVGSAVFAGIEPAVIVGIEEEHTGDDA